MDDRAAKAARARKQLRRHQEAQRKRLEELQLEQKPELDVGAGPPMRTTSRRPVQEDRTLNSALTIEEITNVDSHTERHEDKTHQDTSVKQKESSSNASDNIQPMESATLPNQAPSKSVIAKPLANDSSNGALEANSKSYNGETLNTVFTAGHTEQAFNPSDNLDFLDTDSSQRSNLEPARFDSEMVQSAEQDAPEFADHLFGAPSTPQAHFFSSQPQSDFDTQVSLPTQPFPGNQSSQVTQPRQPTSLQQDIAQDLSYGDTEDLFAEPNRTTEALGLPESTKSPISLSKQQDTVSSPHLPSQPSSSYAWPNTRSGIEYQLGGPRQDNLDFDMESTFSKTASDAFPASDFFQEQAGSASQANDWLSGLSSSKSRSEQPISQSVPIESGEAVASFPSVPESGRKSSDLFHGHDDDAGNDAHADLTETYPSQTDAPLETLDGSPWKDQQATTESLFGDTSQLKENIEFFSDHIDHAGTPPHLAAPHPSSAEVSCKQEPLEAGISQDDPDKFGLDTSADASAFQLGSDRDDTPPILTTNEPEFSLPNDYNNVQDLEASRYLPVDVGSVEQTDWHQDEAPELLQSPSQPPNKSDGAFLQPVTWPQDAYSVDQPTEDGISAPVAEPISESVIPEEAPSSHSYDIRPTDAGDHPFYQEGITLDSHASSGQQGIVTDSSEDAASLFGQEFELQGSEADRTTHDLFAIAEEPSDTYGDADGQGTQNKDANIEQISRPSSAQYNFYAHEPEDLSASQIDLLHTAQRTIASLETERRQLMDSANDTAAQMSSLNATIAQLQDDITRLQNENDLLRAEVKQAKGNTLANGGVDASSSDELSRLREENHRIQVELEQFKQASNSSEIKAAQAHIRKLEEELNKEAAASHTAKLRVRELESQASRESRRVVSNPVLPSTGRLHRRTATSASLSAPRLSPLAEQQPITMLKRAPAEGIRRPSRFREDITPEQRHRRQESLQMLRARINDSNDESSSGPRLPSSTFSIVQAQDQVTGFVHPDQPDSRNQANQFSRDALLFCSSCQGDLIIV